MKIYYFGDSNTKGIGNIGSPIKDLYFHVPYRKYLTELMGIEEVNFSRPGKHFLFNLNDLVSNLNQFKNGDYVIFQAQFFCNSLLKYDEFSNYNMSDIIITNYLLNKNIIDFSESSVSDYFKPHKQTLIDWSLEFEERRSIYDLYVLIEILKYLRTKGIKSYLLYWIQAFTIELPDSEVLLKINNSKYVCDGKQPSILTATNGLWKDFHTSNDFNEYLAKQIYSLITENYK